MWIVVDRNDVLLYYYMMVIRKVTPGEPLTKQATRKNIIYKNTYLSYFST
jgi:hypothetical protein